MAKLLRRGEVEIEREDGRKGRRRRRSGDIDDDSRRESKGYEISTKDLKGEDVVEGERRESGGLTATAGAFFREEKDRKG